MTNLDSFYCISRSLPPSENLPVVPSVKSDGVKTQFVLECKLNITPAVEESGALLLTTLLALDTAKKRPSDPVGASDATQELCLGLHKTSPRVMNTCHTQAPAAYGKIATNTGEVAIIQRPDNCNIAFYMAMSS